MVLLKGQLNRLIAPAIALVCVGVIAVLQASKLTSFQREAEQTRTTEEYQQETVQTQSSLALIQKMPTFGYDNLVADWTFLNFLQYFGDRKARLQTDYQLSPTFFEIIVDRDPRFLDAYFYLSTSISLFAAQPQKAVDLIQTGMASMSPQTEPQAYYVLRSKGTDQLLFLGDTQAASQSFLKAADWITVSGDPDGPELAKDARQTAQFIRQYPNSKRVQIFGWINILTSAVDEQTRDRAKQEIQDLGGKFITTAEGNTEIKLPPED